MISNLKVDESLFDGMDNDYKVYSYRFVYQIRGEDRLAVEFITAKIDVIDKVRKELLERDDIMKACVFYMGEFDIRFMDVPEVIKDLSIEESKSKIFNKEEFN